MSYSGVALCDAVGHYVTLCIGAKEECLIVV